MIKKEGMKMFNNGNDLVMPVAPMYGGYGGNGNGFLGGDGIWVILLFALIFNGGWGGFGGFGGMGGFAADGAMLYPWMNQAEITTQGFQNQMLNDTINSVRDGVTSLATQLCNTGSDIQMSLANGFAGVEQGANTRQIANMQQAFANQQAMNQGFNSVGLQLCEASGDNRLATANLGADIAREACATRTSDTQNTQLILNAINDGFRQMNEYRFQDKLDAKNDEIAQLRQENLYARGQASQIAQTAELRQSGATQLNQLVSELRSCPIPAQPVYGSTPIFSCNSGCGNGCGCNNF